MTPEPSRLKAGSDPKPAARTATPAVEHLDPSAPPSPAASGRVDQLAFLHEFAQLLTEARDWDELMRTLVDRTTVALGVEVCSFYLLDRDGVRLTLAATNGLDSERVGEVSLAVGQGITGRTARTRKPVTSRDVTTDPQFSWVRGFDVHGLHAMLSTPLLWNQQLIGVVNVQTAAIRDFTPDEVEFLGTIAALLGGLVEKGRMQAEAEAQLDRLSQLDAARAELLAVVTHELRTPLAVVRAYVDLLADAAAANTAGDRQAQIETWRVGTVDQVTRLDRLVDGILASVRGEGLTGLRRDPFDVVAAATWPGSRRCSSRSSTTRPSTPRPSRRSRSASGGSATRCRSTSPTTAPASPSRTGRQSSSRTFALTGPARAARASACSRPGG